METLEQDIMVPFNDGNEALCIEWDLLQAGETLDPSCSKLLCENRENQKFIDRINRAELFLLQFLIRLQTILNMDGNNNKLYPQMMRVFSAVDDIESIFFSEILANMQKPEAVTNYMRKFSQMINHGRPISMKLCDRVTELLIASKYMRIALAELPVPDTKQESVI